MGKRHFQPKTDAGSVRVCVLVFFNSGAPLNAHTREGELLPPPGSFCNRDFASHAHVVSPLRSLESRAGLKSRSPRATGFAAWCFSISEILPANLIPPVPHPNLWDRIPQMTIRIWKLNSAPGCAPPAKEIVMC